MDEFFSRVWSDLLSRSGGPIFARLLVQPIVAGILAIRAGRKDVAAGRKPYLWGISTGDPAERRKWLRQGWNDVGKLFIVAVILDLIYQVIALHTVWIGETVLVATCLAFVPYAVIRSAIRRVWGRNPGPPTLGKR